MTSSRPPDAPRTTTPPDLPEGLDDLNVEHYRILRQLGEGPNGVVYLARDVRVPEAEPVALKLIPRGLRASFCCLVREAGTVRSLQHPQIARFFRYGETPEGACFTVSEFLRGGTLEQLMAAHHQKMLQERLVRSESVQVGLPPGMVLDVGRQVASALATAHGMVTAHRNLKPTNVLTTDPVERVLETGIASIKLVDFGIAPRDYRSIPEVTATGAVLGIPPFAAPEQLVSGGPDNLDAELDWERLCTAASLPTVVTDPREAHVADIFSLGQLLYYLWVGLPLCRVSGSSFRESGDALLRGWRAALLTSVEDFRKNPPECIQRAGASELLQAMLAPEPLDRPNAQEVGKSLRELRGRSRARGDVRFTGQRSWGDEESGNYGAARSATSSHSSGNFPASPPAPAPEPEADVPLEDWVQAAVFELGDPSGIFPAPTPSEENPRASRPDLEAIPQSLLQDLPNDGPDPWDKSERGSDSGPGAARFEGGTSETVWTVPEGRPATRNAQAPVLFASHRQERSSLAWLAPLVIVLVVAAAVLLTLTGNSKPPQPSSSAPASSH